MIVIIDYGLGNLFSVKNAFYHLGIDAKISASPSDIIAADALVIPGQGAFRDGIKNLHERDLVKVLNDQVIEKKKPLLGLCLGMQLIFDKSYEGGEYIGLGWIKGEVRRIKAKNGNVRLPHVGWNDVDIVREDEVMIGYKRPPVYYFVHSYIVVAEEESVATGYCTYGEKFAATISQRNIYGAQFHPEKSQADGLKLLNNFVKYA